MNLFTVILEYRGGTYIDQFVSTDIESASEAWVIRKRNSPLFGDSNSAFFDRYECNIKKFGFVEIAGTLGVWPFDFSFENQDAWGHFILGPKIG